MTIDLEERLDNYRSTLDAAVGSDRLDGRRAPRRSAPGRWAVMASVAVAVALGAVGVLALRPEPAPDLAVTSGSSGDAGASATEGLLPRLVVMEEGFEPAVIEDYVVDGDPYSRIVYLRRNADDRVESVAITLHPLRRPAGWSEQCVDGRAVQVHTTIGVLASNDSGDKHLVMWAVDDDTEGQVIASGVDESAVAGIAGSIASVTEEDWVELRESLPADGLITDASNEFATHELTLETEFLSVTDGWTVSAPSRTDDSDEIVEAYEVMTCLRQLIPDSVSPTTTP